MMRIRMRRALVGIGAALAVGAVVTPEVARAQSANLVNGSSPYTDVSDYLLVQHQAIPTNATGTANPYAVDRSLGSATLTSGSNVASVTQRGTQNAASIAQNGFGNNSTTIQLGNDNLSSLTSIGDGNRLSSTQIGSADVATIAVQGQGNAIVATQIGSGLSYGLRQVGDAKTVTVVQARR
ncbi:hypothetical protein [Lichenihabitans psoromatis]|uniref:hypothetical protein n=1 Tax=Lichenihabitans psoromatis TaxID=2528642 RepID=UPI0010368BD1|nr:hypothetical protein [Lichenihabitans psoromatis]